MKKKPFSFFSKFFIDWLYLDSVYNTVKDERWAEYNNTFQKRFFFFF